ncbi:dynein regulatory complex subunit 5 isoform X2 [Denticeps clupeoides]|uniref:T-complex-associated testis-expressed protein 1 n=2 Tax=Denticeps clupeoides TaxID=299321 RepID=A0AAY4CC27_9TELE|nr:dynein regulatory complex subunit 5 isoform X2 [Denticeps clupeoides]XP_028809154.1 dynein regulatory complex subunit 5 isoform X2 [Denticeps clupeoides]
MDPPVPGKIPAADVRKMRRLVAEDPEWSLEVVPLLTHLCLQHIVQNFAENPLLDRLLPRHRARVLEKLPPSLPLHVTANLISEERYWKKCCMERWGLCDVTTYGDSWKRMFFERHLESIIELFIPDVTDPTTVLDMVPLCKNYVKRLKISQLLPPIREPRDIEEEDGVDTASDMGDDLPSIDHFDFGILLDKLARLEELHLAYGVKGCGMNFEWNLFEFSFRDCESLGKALKSCRTLKVLRIHQSRVDDERCRLLVTHLLDHPSLSELNLSHNVIGDRGARALAKLLNRSQLKALNVYDNQIRGHGAKALASALSKNTTLLSLNLCLNCVGDEGGQAAARALLKNGTLVTLHLEANYMTEPTASALSRVFSQNTTLRSIKLCCNRLGVDGGKSLEEGMSRNSTLLECDLRLTEIAQESLCSIGQILRGNRKRLQRRQTPEPSSE